MELMNCQTARFGTVSVPKERIITMEKPILGFERLTSFVIIRQDDFQPFQWLQSIEDPSIAFVIVPPGLFVADYAVEINRREVEDIGVTDPSAVEMYVIVTVPEDPKKFTMNLQGPLIINTLNRRAKQLVLANSERDVAYSVFDDASISEGKSTPVMSISR